MKEEKNENLVNISEEKLKLDWVKQKAYTLCSYKCWFFSRAVIDIGMCLLNTLIFILYVIFNYFLVKERLFPINPYAFEIMVVVGYVVFFLIFKYNADYMQSIILDKSYTKIESILIALEFIYILITIHLFGLFIFVLHSWKIILN